MSPVGLSHFQSYDTSKVTSVSYQELQQQFLLSTSRSLNLTHIQLSRPTSDLTYYCPCWRAWSSPCLWLLPLRQVLFTGEHENTYIFLLLSTLAFVPRPEWSSSPVHAPFPCVLYSHVTDSLPHSILMSSLLFVSSFKCFEYTSRACASWLKQSAQSGSRSNSKWLQQSLRGRSLMTAFLCPTPTLKDSSSKALLSILSYNSQTSFLWISWNLSQHHKEKKVSWTARWLGIWGLM